MLKLGIYAPIGLKVNECGGMAGGLYYRSLQQSNRLTDEDKSFSQTSPTAQAIRYSTTR
jgi:hypothetical protein